MPSSRVGWRAWLARHLMDTCMQANMESAVLAQLKQQWHGMAAFAQPARMLSKSQHKGPQVQPGPCMADISTAAHRVNSILNVPHQSALQEVAECSCHMQRYACIGFFARHLQIKSCAPRPGAAHLAWYTTSNKNSSSNYNMQSHEGGPQTSDQKQQLNTRASGSKPKKKTKQQQQQQQQEQQQLQHAHQQGHQQRQHLQQQQSQQQAHQQGQFQQRQQQEVGAAAPVVAAQLQACLQHVGSAHDIHTLFHRLDAAAKVWRSKMQTGNTPDVELNVAASEVHTSLSSLQEKHQLQVWWSTVLQAACQSVLRLVHPQPQQQGPGLDAYSSVEQTRAFPQLLKNQKCITPLPETEPSRPAGQPGQLHGDFLGSPGVNINAGRVLTHVGRHLCQLMQTDLAAGSEAWVSQVAVAANQMPTSETAHTTQRTSVADPFTHQTTMAVQPAQPANRAAMSLVKEGGVVRGASNLAARQRKQLVVQALQGFLDVCRKLQYVPTQELQNDLADVLQQVLLPSDQASSSTSQHMLLLKQLLQLHPAFFTPQQQQLLATQMWAVTPHNASQLVKLASVWLQSSPALFATPPHTPGHIEAQGDDDRGQLGSGQQHAQHAPATPHEQQPQSQRDGQQYTVPWYHYAQLLVLGLEEKELPASLVLPALEATNAWLCCQQLRPTEAPGCAATAVQPHVADLSQANASQSAQQLWHQLLHITCGNTVSTCGVLAQLVEHDTQQHLDGVAPHGNTPQSGPEAAAAQSIVPPAQAVQHQAAVEGALRLLQQLPYLPVNQDWGYGMLQKLLPVTLKGFKEAAERKQQAPRADGIATVIDQQQAVDILQLLAQIETATRGRRVTSSLTGPEPSLPTLLASSKDGVTGYIATLDLCEAMLLRDCGPTWAQQASAMQLQHLTTVITELWARSQHSHLSHSTQQLLSTLPIPWNTSPAQQPPLGALEDLAALQQLHSSHSHPALSAAQHSYSCEPFIATSTLITTASGADVQAGMLGHNSHTRLPAALSRVLLAVADEAEMRMGQLPLSQAATLCQALTQALGPRSRSRRLLDCLNKQLQLKQQLGAPTDAAALANASGLQRTHTHTAMTLYASHSAAADDLQLTFPPTADGTSAQAWPNWIAIRRNKASGGTSSLRTGPIAVLPTDIWDCVVDACLHAQYAPTAVLHMLQAWGRPEDPVHHGSQPRNSPTSSTNPAPAPATITTISAATAAAADPVAAQPELASSHVPQGPDAPVDPQHTHTPTEAQPLCLHPEATVLDVLHPENELKGPDGQAGLCHDADTQVLKGFSQRQVCPGHQHPHDSQQVPLDTEAQVLEDTPQGQGFPGRQAQYDSQQLQVAPQDKTVGLKLPAHYMSPPISSLKLPQLVQGTHLMARAGVFSKQLAETLWSHLAMGASNTQINSPSDSSCNDTPAGGLTNGSPASTPYKNSHVVDADGLPQGGEQAQRGLNSLLDVLQATAVHHASFRHAVQKPAEWAESRCSSMNDTSPGSSILQGGAANTKSAAATGAAGNGAAAAAALLRDLAHKHMGAGVWQQRLTEWAEQSPTYQFLPVWCALQELQLTKLHPGYSALLQAHTQAAIQASRAQPSGKQHVRANRLGATQQHNGTQQHELPSTAANPPSIGTAEGRAAVASGQKLVPAAHSLHQDWPWLLHSLAVHTDLSTHKELGLETTKNRSTVTDSLLCQPAQSAGSPTVPKAEDSSLHKNSSNVIHSLYSNCVEMNAGQPNMAAGPAQQQQEHVNAHGMLAGTSAWWRMEDTLLCSSTGAQLMEYAANQLSTQTAASKAPTPFQTLACTLQLLQHAARSIAQSLPAPHPQSESQVQSLSPLPSKPQTHSQPLLQPQSQSQPHSQPQSQSQPQLQPQSQPQPQPQAQADWKLASRHLLQAIAQQVVSRPAHFGPAHACVCKSDAPGRGQLDARLECLQQLSQLGYVQLNDVDRCLSSIHLSRSWSTRELQLYVGHVLTAAAASMSSLHPVTTPQAGHTASVAAAAQLQAARPKHTLPQHALSASLLNLQGVAVQKLATHMAKAQPVPPAAQHAAANLHLLLMAVQNAARHQQYHQQLYSLVYNSEWVPTADDEHTVQAVQGGLETLQEANQQLAKVIRARLPGLPDVCFSALPSNEERNITATLRNDVHQQSKHGIDTASSSSSSTVYALDMADITAHNPLYQVSLRDGSTGLQLRTAAGMLASACLQDEAAMGNKGIAGLLIEALSQQPPGLLAMPGPEAALLVRAVLQTQRQASFRLPDSAQCTGFMTRIASHLPPTSLIQLLSHAITLPDKADTGDWISTPNGHSNGHPHKQHSRAPPAWAWPVVKSIMPSIPQLKMQELADLAETCSTLWQATDLTTLTQQDTVSHNTFNNLNLKKGNSLNNGSDCVVENVESRKDAVAPVQEQKQWWQMLNEATLAVAVVALQQSGRMLHKYLQTPRHATVPVSAIQPSQYAFVLHLLAKSATCLHGSDAMASEFEGQMWVDQFMSKSMRACLVDLSAALPQLEGLLASSMLLDSTSQQAPGSAMPTAAAPAAITAPPTAAAAAVAAVDRVPAELGLQLLSVAGLLSGLERVLRQPCTTNVMNGSTGAVPAQKLGSGIDGSTGAVPPQGFSRFPDASWQQSHVQQYKVLEHQYRQIAQAVMRLQLDYTASHTPPDTTFSLVTQVLDLMTIGAAPQDRSNLLQVAADLLSYELDRPGLMVQPKFVPHITQALSCFAREGLVPTRLLLQATTTVAAANGDALYGFAAPDSWGWQGKQQTQRPWQWDNWGKGPLFERMPQPPTHWKHILKVLRQLPDGSHTASHFLEYAAERYLLYYYPPLSSMYTSRLPEERVNPRHKPHPEAVLLPWLELYMPPTHADGMRTLTATAFPSYAVPKALWHATMYHLTGRLGDLSDAQLLRLGPTLVTLGIGAGYSGSMLSEEVDIRRALVKELHTRAKDNGASSGKHLKRLPDSHQSTDLVRHHLLLLDFLQVLPQLLPDRPDTGWVHDLLAKAMQGMQLPALLRVGNLLLQGTLLPASTWFSSTSTAQNQQQMQTQLQQVQLHMPVQTEMQQGQAPGALSQVQQAKEAGSDGWQRHGEDDVCQHRTLPSVDQLQAAIHEACVHPMLAALLLRVRDMLYTLSAQSGLTPRRGSKQSPTPSGLASSADASGDGSLSGHEQPMLVGFAADSGSAPAAATAEQHVLLYSMLTKLRDQLQLCNMYAMEPAGQGWTQQLVDAQQGVADTGEAEAQVPDGLAGAAGTIDISTYQPKIAPTQAEEFVVNGAQPMRRRLWQAASAVPAEHTCLEEHSARDPDEETTHAVGVDITPSVVGQSDLGNTGKTWPDVWQTVQNSQPGQQQLVQLVQRMAEAVLMLSATDQDCISIQHTDQQEPASGPDSAAHRLLGRLRTLQSATPEVRFEALALGPLQLAALRDAKQQATPDSALQLPAQYHSLLQVYGDDLGRLLAEASTGQSFIRHASWQQLP